MSLTIIGGNVIAAMTGGVFHTASLARTGVGTQLLGVSPASIIADYIINTLGKMSYSSDKAAWPLFISHLPDGDDVRTDCGAIFDTPGINDGRMMTGEWPQHPGIQLRIRSQVYETAYAKMEDIANSLDAVNNISIIIGVEEYEIQNIRRTSAIINLGMEEGTKRRRNLTINFLLTLKKLT